MLRGIIWLGAAMAASPALAGISASLVPVTLPSSVSDLFAPEFDTASYQSYDLQITLTGSSDWTAADLRGVLSAGTFFNHGVGGNPPSPALFPTFPALQFDTHVTTPAGTAPTFLLSHPSDASATPIFDPMLTSAAWGDGSVSGPGTYTIARITMTSDAVGTISGRVYRSDDAAATNFSLVVPEPASLAGLALAGLALGRRRRQH